jgi:hypothetical protein
VSKIILILALAVVVLGVHSNHANAIPTKHHWTSPEHSGGGDDDEPLISEQGPLSVDRNREARRAEPVHSVVRINDKRTRGIVAMRRVEFLWIWMMPR